MAIWLHTAGSYPSVVSIRRRTSRRRRLRLEESAHGVAQLVLLFGEREVHGWAPRMVGELGLGERPRTLPERRRRPARPGARCRRYPGAMPRPAHYETPAVRIEKLIVGPFENNVFVVRCKGTGEAVIIDAANEHELLLEVSKATGVRRVLTTHGHWDHIQAVEAMRDAGIDVGIAGEDADDAARLRLRDPRRRRDRGRRAAAAHHPQPGPHARFHLVPARGPPDPVQRRHPVPRRRRQHELPGGNFEQIIESIDRRLFTLPADTLVLPGHGLDTTIGTERPHLQEWVDRGW